MKNKQWLVQVECIEDEMPKMRRNQSVQFTRIDMIVKAKTEREAREVAAAMSEEAGLEDVARITAGKIKPFKV